MHLWPEHNYKTENECWVIVNRGRPKDDKTFWYIDAVEAVLPDMSSEGFRIDNDILKALQEDHEVWENFLKFPPLYQRVRTDTIQIKKKNPELFQSRLKKLIENTKKDSTRISRFSNR